jgi:AcrR family transcriptional regulator
MRDRKLDILEASRRVVACRKVCGFRVEDVAREAGLSVAIYRHVENRKGLLGRVLKHANDRADTCTQSGPPEYDRPREQLDQILLREIRDDPAVAENIAVWKEMHAPAENEGSYSSVLRVSPSHPPRVTETLPSGELGLQRGRTRSLDFARDDGRHWIREPLQLRAERPPHPCRKGAGHHGHEEAPSRCPQHRSRMTRPVRSVGRERRWVNPAVQSALDVDASRAVGYSPSPVVAGRRVIQGAARRGGSSGRSALHPVVTDPAAVSAAGPRRLIRA